MEVVGIAMDERQRDQHRAGDRESKLASFRARHRRLDSSPAGRMNIMMMKKPKAST